VLPAACHLRRAMVASEDDPGYVARFKDAITTDLDSRLQNCNMPWLKMSGSTFQTAEVSAKVRERGSVGDVSTVSRAQLEAVTQSTSTGTDVEPLMKKPRMFELSSDSDGEPLAQPSSASTAVQRYKAEPQIDNEACPLEWWRPHAAAHPVIASIWQHQQQLCHVDVCFHYLGTLSTRSVQMLTNWSASVTGCVLSLTNSDR
jgi:hypothetical protein